MVGEDVMYTVKGSGRDEERYMMFRLQMEFNTSRFLNMLC